MILCFSSKMLEYVKIPHLYIIVLPLVMLVTSTFSNYLSIAAHAIGSTKEGTGLERSTATGA